MEPVSITLVIVTIANLLVSIIGHIKKSTCCGCELETEQINSNHQ